MLAKKALYHLEPPPHLLFTDSSRDRKLQVEKQSG
jgi:hypothetical protein